MQGGTRIKQLLSVEMDRLDYLMYIHRASVVDDQDSVIVVDVGKATAASYIARRFAAPLRRVLALVNRPETVLRLRGNLAEYEEEPDFYYRDVPPPVEVHEGADG